MKVEDEEHVAPVEHNDFVLLVLGADKSLDEKRRKVKRGHFFFFFLTMNSHVPHLSTLNRQRIGDTCLLKQAAAAFSGLPQQAWLAPRTCCQL